MEEYELKFHNVPGSRLTRERAISYFRLEVNDVENSV